MMAENNKKSSSVEPIAIKKNTLEEKLKDEKTTEALAKAISSALKK